jgi:anti-sigma factor RsiW
MEISNRDRFELLSAYLDGEVTADERRQVEAWLETDANTQRLYERLLMVRHTMTSLPIPPSSQSTEQLMGGVFGKLERRGRRRWAWGGAAIAATVVGTVSALIPINLTPASQFGKISEPTSDVASVDVPDDALMIALDQPIIEIPSVDSDITKANKQIVN